MSNLSDNFFNNIKDLFKFFSGKPAFIMPKVVPVDQFPENNSGILEGKKDTDFDVVAGTSIIPYEIVLPSADWRPFIVKGEKQYYTTFDTFNCTGFSNNNCAEIQLKQSTGLEYNFSDEAMSVLAQCMKNGNYLYKPADVGRNIGRILQEDWTILDPKSWEDYNQPIPADIMKKVYRFNERYQWVATDKASMKYHLKQAPVQIIINNGSHAVCCVFVDDTGWWYFDSYEPWLKKTTVQPSSALQLIVKPITQFVHRSGTQEYGFYAPGTDVEAFKNLGFKLGMPVVRDDGTIPFNKAREITIN